MATSALFLCRRALLRTTPFSMGASARLAERSVPSSLTRMTPALFTVSAPRAMLSTGSSADKESMSSSAVARIKAAAAQARGRVGGRDNANNNNKTGKRPANSPQRQKKGGNQVLGQQRQKNADTNLPWNQVQMKRCVAYCTADKYNFHPLLLRLKQHHEPSLHSNEIIHVDWSKKKNRTQIIDTTGGGPIILPADPQHSTVVEDHMGPTTGESFFFFREGVVVCWNTTASEERTLLVGLRDLEGVSVRDMEHEEMDYVVGASTACMAGDTIALTQPDHTTDTGYTSATRVEIQERVMMEKIAFSYGLQRSVKLAVIEAEVERVISNMRHITDDLVAMRKLTMSREATLQRMGVLLALRGTLNMHSPLLETPDMYWEETEFESLYEQMVRALDLRKRVHETNSELQISFL